MRYSYSRTEAWLILLRTPHLGSVRIRALLERYGSIQTCIDALRAQPPPGLPHPSLAWLRCPDQLLIDSDLAWIEQDNHRLLSYDEEDFPPQLNVCAGSPPALFVVGDTTRLLYPQVAIVGARAASPEGLANAHNFASALAAAGFVVSSGLATGIDAAAHTAALAYKTGTIAVMGTGPDRIYPRHHCKLAARIAETGSLVTAFPPGTPARATHFPQRNRV
ncbi:MAG TPA: DNA-processing protein DprA, partial [Mizugakiibacter sp.]|nr:DNA-processing protein DprA [Mizugakiibacter sp.]